MQRISQPSRGIEARGQLSALLGGTGVAQAFAGQGQPQQQYIHPFAPGEQCLHLGGAALVEQEVGVGGLQIDIARVDGQGFAVSGFGGGDPAPALFGFGQAGQHPQAFCGAHGCFARQGVAQRLRRGSGQAGGRIHLSAAAERRQRCGERGKPLAGLACLGIAGLHHQDRSPPKPSLVVLSIGADHGIEIGQGLVEAVAELQHHGALHPQRQRWIGMGPPRAEGGLRATEVARIAVGVKGIDAMPHQGQCRLGIARVAPPGAAQGSQFARLRIVGARRHALDDFGVGAWRARLTPGGMSSGRCQPQQDRHHEHEAGHARHAVMLAPAVRERTAPRAVAHATSGILSTAGT